MIKAFIFSLLLITPALKAQEPLKVYAEFEDFQKEILEGGHPDTTYVINFWATWCRPCVKELPFFDTLSTKYSNRPIKVILVSMDMEERIESNLKPFLERKHIKDKVVVLTAGKPNSWIDLVDPSWSGAIPATIILKGANKTFYEKSYHSFQELENDLLKIHPKTE